MSDVNELLLREMPIIVTLNEAVYDDNGEVTDFVLVDVNRAVESRMSLKRDDIIGMRMKEWLFQSADVDLKWFDALAETFKSGERTEFELIMERNGRWYLVFAFVPKKDHLAVYFHEASRYKQTESNIEKIKQEFEHSLKQSERVYLSLFFNSPSAIIVYKVNGDGSVANDYIIEAVNPKCLEIESWKREDVVGKQLGDMRPGIEEFGIVEIFQKVHKTGETIKYPARVYHEKGVYKWYENIVFKIPSGEIVAIYSDVTPNKLAELALYEEKEKLKTTLYSIGDGVITTDGNGSIEMINKVAEELTGWNYGEATGQYISNVFDVSDKSEDIYENSACLSLESGEIVNLPNYAFLRSKSGKESLITERAAPIINGNGEITGSVLVFRDLTEENKKLEKIEFLSYRDPVTGLYNRAYFQMQLDRIEKKMMYPVTVIMGDLDGLKIINDAFGYQVGDKALAAVAKSIRNQCRETDTLFRWGGDEFVILLPHTNERKGQEICAKIKDASNHRILEETKLSISLGCAEKTNADSDWKDVIKEAEDNMYKSKLLGAKSYRNVVLQSIVSTLFEKSYETKEHGDRLGYFCREVGTVLGLSDFQLDELEVLSMLHDIGKVGIDERILMKPGKLTDEEWTEMKKHPEMGYRIAHTVPELSAVSEYILSHHERWDGKGYPRNLKGEEIPLLARILTVVDSFDAMTQDRPYRKAISVEEAKKELFDNAGTQFDPHIVEIFLAFLDNKTQEEIQ